MARASTQRTLRDTESAEKSKTDLSFSPCSLCSSFAYSASCFFSGAALIGDFRGEPAADVAPASARLCRSPQEVDEAIERWLLMVQQPFVVGDRASVAAGSAREQDRP
jgi:hypothetical protein